MAAAAPGGTGKDDGVPRRMSRAELVKRWEDVFDNVGDEEGMELFMALLLRDARAEHAQQARKEREEEEEEEEEERRVRLFEPLQLPPPGSSAPPPPPPPLQPPPRLERTVVLGLRAPPHLLPRSDQRTAPSSATAADLGRSVKPAK